MMENTKLVLVICILMCSCGTLCVTSSSSSDLDLGDYLGSMIGGQSYTCMEKLLPCQPYLVPGPAPPPANCCIPLKELISNDTKCICDTFNNPLVRGSLNVSLDDVMKLPKACNETFDIAVCKTATASSPPADKKSSSSSVSTASLDSTDSPSDSGSTPDSDPDSPPGDSADSTPDADSKASGANGKFGSSSGREYIISLAFSVAFILSVYQF